MENHQLLADLIIILGSATLVATLFFSFRIPPLVGFLLTGVIIGPHGLSLIRNLPRVEILTEIAGILLMFTIGLEFSLRQLLSLRTTLLVLGLGQMALTILIFIFFLYYVLNLSISQSFFFSTILSLSSTAVVLKLLKDSRSLESPFGQTSLSILLFQDISVIPLLFIIPLLSNHQIDSSHYFNLPVVGVFILKSFGLIIFVLISSRWIVPFVLHRVVNTRSNEVFFFSLLFICAGTALIIQSIGLSLSLGAFFAGLMISSSPYGKQATVEFTPLRDNFLSLFFVSIGMLIDLGFLSSHFLQITYLTMSVLLIKFVSTFIILWFFGQSPSISSITALILFQIGEFSFVLVDQGRSKGLMNDEQYQYFLSISIISLAFTPLFYRIAPRLGLKNSTWNFVPQKFQHFAEQFRIYWIKDLSENKKLSSSSKIEEGGHTLIIGFGIAGQEVASALKNLGLPYRIVEMNSRSVREGKSKGEPITYGDATRAEILQKVGIERAHLVIIVVNSLEITEAILTAVYQLRPDIQTLVRFQYLRDLSQVKLTPNVIPIVSEFETSLEILNRTLSAYGAESKQIFDFTLEAQNRLKQTSESLSHSERRTIELPAWQALTSLYPLRLKGSCFAVTKSLAEIDLRKRSGATVAFVFREGLGVAVPGPDFIFEQEDILYMLGSSESIQTAKSFLLSSER